MNQLIQPIPRPLEGVPDRFYRPLPHTRQEAIDEIDRLASILWHGAQQLSGLYLRICDLIRNCDLTECEIRSVLSRHFPPQRVSEFMKVANAPDEVYRRYRAGFFGFKAALQECRGYRVTPSSRLRRRSAERAAIRLASLMGEGAIDVQAWHVTVSKSIQP